MTRALALAALLSCSPELDPGKPWSYAAPEIPNWTAYNGTFTWRIVGAGAEEPGCELIFDFEGSPVEDTCEDCEYAFRLDMTYQEDESINTWRCVDPDTADFSWVLGFDADFYGYDVGAMWMFHEYGAYWTQAFYTELDGDTLSFGYDYTSWYAYYYEYYLYSYFGTGTVEE